jgi:phosphatidylglycerophosphatase A
MWIKRVLRSIRDGMKSHPAHPTEEDAQTLRQPTNQLGAESVACFVATGAGVGYAPVAPGTAGSLLALCLYLVYPLPEPIGWAFLLMTLFLFGIASTSTIPDEWGKDPGRVVIDEMVGFWFAVALLPRTFTTVIAGFLIFRGLDIVKPPPARAAERLPKGWGIMMDDVIVGIYTNLIIRLLTKIL